MRICSWLYIFLNNKRVTKKKDADIERPWSVPLCQFRWSVWICSLCMCVFASKQVLFISLSTVFAIVFRLSEVKHCLFNNIHVWADEREMNFKISQNTYRNSNNFNLTRWNTWLPLNWRQMLKFECFPDL